MKVKALVAQLCLTLCNPVYYSMGPHRLEPIRLLCPLNSPDKNSGVGIHSLLQGIFLTEELNLGLLHGGQILHHLTHQEAIPFSFSRLLVNGFCLLVSLQSLR